MSAPIYLFVSRFFSRQLSHAPLQVVRCLWLCSDVQAYVWYVCHQAHITSPDTLRVTPEMVSLECKECCIHVRIEPLMSSPSFEV